MHAQTRRLLCCFLSPDHTCLQAACPPGPFLPPAYTAGAYRGPATVQVRECHFHPIALLRPATPRSATPRPATPWPWTRCRSPRPIIQNETSPRGRPCTACTASGCRPRRRRQPRRAALGVAVHRCPFLPSSGWKEEGVSMTRPGRMGEEADFGTDKHFICLHLHRFVAVPLVISFHQLFNEG